MAADSPPVILTQSSGLSGSVTASSTSSSSSSSFSVSSFLSPSSNFIKLTTENFPLWKIQLEPYLRGHGLFGWLDGSKPKPAETVNNEPNPDYVTWKQTDQLIMSLMNTSMSESVLTQGCKPVAVAIDHMDIVGGSASVSPYSSHQPSPRASYSPSPSSSSFPSPAHYMASLARNFNPNNTDPNSLIPWLKNLSSNGTTTTNSSSQSPKLPYLYMGGSISAPVTPPLSSPMCTTPRARNDHYWEDSNAALPWLGPAEQYSLPSSTPPSPGRQVLPEPAWLANVQDSQTSPTSPTFSLVSSNPFGLREGGSGSRMWTPGQSGACSPAIPAGSDGTGDVPMSGLAPSEFAFGSCSMTGMVKAWEGERIHEESANEPDDLELTLGSSRTR